MTGPRLLATTLILVFLAVSSSPGHALTWQEIESVDDPVTEISSTAGRCVTFGDGMWFAAYVKGGVVHVATRTDVGWDTPEPLTAGPGTRTSPQLAFAAGILHVIWASDESGHAEIYTRNWDGTAWSAESCLTCDTTPSRAGVLAGDKIPWDSTDYVLAVWEDGTVGSTEILGRVFHDGAWGSAEVVSDSPGNATEPSVTTYDGPTFVVA